MDNAINSRRDMSRPNSRSYTPRSQGRNGFGASNLYIEGGRDSPFSDAVSYGLGHLKYSGN
jgi:hypothetical protein